MVVTGRAADENLLVVLLYVLKVVNVARLRGVGGVVAAGAPRCLCDVLGCCDIV